MTGGIVEEYSTEAKKFPQFQLLPTLQNLSRGGRAVRVDERNLDRSQIRLTGLPQEHSGFIVDAIAGRASYLITNRREWLELSEQTESRYGLRIVSPGGFAELES
jgi:hypothetical protein